MRTSTTTAWVVWLATALPVAALVVPEGERVDPKTGAEDEPVVFDERERRIIGRMSPLPALKPDPTNRWGDDPSAARFGQRLFFEKRFSSNGEISCATCHPPDQAFQDAVPTGEGLEQLPRHTPTLLNVAHQRWFFWDGRADSLWAQALQPWENELEFGGDRLAILHTLSADEQLRAEYESIFGPLPDFSDVERFPEHARPVAGGSRRELLKTRLGRDQLAEGRAWRLMATEDQEIVNAVFANLGKAVAAYERRLIGGTSAFDQFAAALAEGDEGDMEAFSASARRGLKLFIGKANCRLCHGGPQFSDLEFHDIGMPPLGGGQRTDPGRHDGARKVLRDPFNALSSYSDLAEDEPSDARDKLEYLNRVPELWGQFKTPSLRNVARTAPYMHEGQKSDLDEVLRYYSTLEGASLMGHHQETILVPLALSEGELADLKAFLQSLSDGPLPAELLAPPQP